MNVAEAVDTLNKAFADDSDFRYSYQANIAMAFVDNVHWHKQKTGKKSLNRQDVQTIANEAADYFLKQLAKKPERASA